MFLTQVTRQTLTRARNQHAAPQDRIRQMCVLRVHHISAHKAYSDHDQEAVSVTTPPIKQSAGGNPKSIFMDIKHPLPTYDSASSSASSAWAVPRVFSHRKGAEAERREWWDEPKALVRRDPVKGVSFFEFDMPEHLPSSPMCPANPMHRLKGKGVCVVSSTVPLLIQYWLDLITRALQFHGRSKQASMDDEAGISEEHLMESR